ncbi:MAG TPA: M56 family metallopeptidase [Candidatus Kapabacteria bacterium]|nr:M56 family metallopeptidase [Candidatus Kapabacteria bacterium]HPO63278.1 M56 family metallopeptidase [Candidatus Kapabacteria bacterium]
METIMLYLAKSVLISGIVFCLYSIFLKKEPFHQSNRIFLLSGAILAIILPAIDFNSEKIAPFSEEVKVMISEVTANQSEVNSVSFEFSFINIIIIAYFIISLLLICKLAIQFILLKNIYKKSRVETIGKIKVVETFMEYPPFSFFNFIFICSKGLDNDERERILHHEKIHIKQFHSIDLLFFDILLIVFWFNPFFWLIKKSLKSIHEYIADVEVLKAGCNRKEYQNLILKEAFGLYNISFINRLNYSLTKRRFVMMSNSKPRDYAFLKYVAILPIMLALMLVFNSYSSIGSEQTKDKKKQMETDLKKKQMEKNTNKIDNNKEFIELDELPGCDLKELSKNIVYPEDARKEGKEGKVFVSAYVNVKGEVEKVKIEKSDNTFFDKAAITAVKNTKFKPGMKDKKPVAAWVTIPINFKLK